MGIEVAAVLLASCHSSSRSVDVYPYRYEPEIGATIRSPAGTGIFVDAMLNEPQGVGAADEPRHPIRVTIREQQPGSASSILDTARDQYFRTAPGRYILVVDPRTCSPARTDVDLTPAGWISVVFGC